MKPPKIRQWTLSASEYPQLLRQTLEGQVQAALEGDRESLKRVARLAAGALYIASGVYPKDTQLVDEAWLDEEDAGPALHCLADALMRIAQGEEPNRVLGWTNSRRGRPPRHKVDPLRATEDYNRLCEVELLRESLGLTTEEACAQVAENYRDDPDRLLNLWKRT